MNSLSRAWCPFSSPKSEMRGMAGVVEDLERRKGKDALALKVVELEVIVADDLGHGWLPDALCPPLLVRFPSSLLRRDAVEAAQVVVNDGMVDGDRAVAL